MTGIPSDDLVPYRTSNFRVDRDGLGADEAWAKGDTRNEGNVGVEVCICRPANVLKAAKTIGAQESWRSYENKQSSKSVCFFRAAFQVRLSSEKFGWRT